MFRSDPDSNPTRFCKPDPYQTIFWYTDATSFQKSDTTKISGTATLHSRDYTIGARCFIIKLLALWIYYYASNARLQALPGMLTSASAVYSIYFCILYNMVYEACSKLTYSHNIHIHLLENDFFRIFNEHFFCQKVYISCI